MAIAPIQSTNHVDWSALAGLGSSPWAISESGRDSILRAIQTRDGAPLKGTRTTTNVDGVAVVPIAGPLSSKDNWLSVLFGASSYETIAKDFRAALDSSEVKAIVLDIDSPGGNAEGCGELSKLIYSARGKKPIVAYVGGAMCSAAYWVGSAADRIVVDPSALVGSIGVRTVMVDASALMETMGIKQYDIVSEQSPYKVSDASKEEDRARMTAMVTTMAEVFISDVARNRSVPAATVKSDFGKGDVLVGADAVKARMADRTGDLDSLIAELSAERPKASAISASTKRKAKHMAKCKGCNKASSDDEEMYCLKCWDDDDDGDEDAKASFLAITGKKTVGEAVAAVAGWKQAASEIEEIKASLAAQAKQARLAEFDAALAAATLSGAIPPAANHPRRVFAGKLRDKEDGVAQLQAYVDSLGATPAAAIPVATEQQAAITGVVAVAPVLGLTAEEQRMAKLLGIDPAKYAAHKADYKRGFQPVAEEK